jgi:hypothetical protein
LFRRHSVISDSKLPLVIQVKEIARPYRLVRELSGGADDGRDAAACRLHPPFPDAEQVLPAVPRFACEMGGLDVPASEEGLQSCGVHVYI